MGTLIIMVGLPGSGKSTYAKKCLQLHPDWKYVSRDEVRYQYVADQEHYFDHETDVYNEFCNRISMHLINGDTVIADATHLTVNSRTKLVNKLDIKPDMIIALCMDTPFEVCMARNSKREGIIRVPDKAMFRMKNSYQRPNPLVENIDKVIRILDE